jgi:hypothetical protein
VCYDHCCCFLLPFIKNDDTINKTKMAVILVGLVRRY